MQGCLEGVGWVGVDKEKWQEYEVLNNKRWDREVRQLVATERACTNLEVLQTVVWSVVLNICMAWWCIGTSRTHSHQAYRNRSLSPQAEHAA